MSSLQEQLLKAGLTTKQKARQANSAQRKKNKQKRSGVQHEASLQEQVKQNLAIKQAKKVAKDVALNVEKKQQLAEKEQHLRIKQILEHHQLNNVSGESEYNYTDGNKIKKIFIDNITHTALINGRLALCGQDDITYIVTSETAAKLAKLDMSIILVQNDKIIIDNVSEDDPYADYQIPDDLMW